METYLNISLLIVLLFLILYISYRVIFKNIFFNHRLLTPFAKYFYNYLYSHKAIEHLHISNYGFVPVDEEISRYDPDHQPGLQLYKELAKNQIGFLINEKYSVVEVGCGKGAGAEFLIKKFNPANFTGIDYSEKAIEFCLLQYPHIKNAEFICADAHKLPLKDHSADVVINVESSHIYKDIDRYFKEVHRILKPGGNFLIADYRIVSKSPIEILEKKMTSNGFIIEETRIISQQVLNACLQESDRRKTIIDTHSPWFLKKYFEHYAILKGSKKSVMLANGEIVYFIYHLVKKK